MLLMATLGGGVLLGTAQQAATPTQAISRDDRARAHTMLAAVYEDVNKRYYDASFHGVDLATRYKKYDEELDTTPTLGSSFRVIAAFVSGLKDSHTYFLPPPRSYSFFYGFRLGMIGDHCFITEVRPGSDAANKVHAGDEVVRLDGYTIDRKDYSDLSYSINLLQPQPQLRLSLVDPAGATREVTVMTKYVEHSRLTVVGPELYNQAMLEGDEMDQLYRQRYYKTPEVFAWRLMSFNVDPTVIDAMYDKAHGSPAIVLDLRGNGGGSVDTLKELLHLFVQKKTKIGDIVGRRSTHELTVSPDGKGYRGKLFVLVDGGSASASELFARTVQLEHLGTVMGDTSAGAVMESQIFPHATGADTITIYADAVAVNNIVMSDGKSLEGAGITPDIIAIPTPADMAAGRDTVLAQAISLAGGKADPEALQQAFAYPWPPYNPSH